MASTEMNSMYLANPSFSQMSFHHSMVTKLPNHCRRVQVEMNELEENASDSEASSALFLSTYAGLSPDAQARGQSP